MSTDLSIIIVNWNSADYIRECLYSIYTDTTQIRFEIIVVDNASYDGCEGIIKNEFKNVVFIQSNENLGFAKANNLGSKYSSGEVLLFLNPDTKVIGQAINRMYSHLLSLPDAGIIGCKLLNSDLSLQTSCVQPFPTILNQTLDIEVIKLRFPYLRLWGMRPLLTNSSSPMPVEVISGACLMIKRDVFLKVRMFSTDYFMYTEDIDLSYKVTSANYRVYYTSDACVIHHGGGSSQQKQSNHFSDILMRESVCTFIRKYKGARVSLLYRSVMFFSGAIRIMTLLVFLSVRSILGQKTELVGPLAKWKNILRWSLHMETWARKLNLAKRNML